MSNIVKKFLGQIIQISNYRYLGLKLRNLLLPEILPTFISTCPTFIPTFPTLFLLYSY